MDTLEHPALGVVIACDTETMTDTTPTPEHPEHTGTSEATFGMKRAAQVAGISVSTIRRHKDTLRKYGAIIEPDGWQVPISALVAADLMRPQTPPDKMPATEQETTTSKAASTERDTDVLLELERLRHRAELAEERQRSAEREAELLREALQVERRMITESQRITAMTSTTEPQREQDTTPAAEQGARPERSAGSQVQDVEQEHHHEQAPAAPRPSWFRRMFG